MRAADPDVLRRNILLTDGADHLRLRGSVRDVFTRSFIGGLREGIARIAADTIDSIRAGVEFDFMTDIALPLPIAVAAAWMGLDAGAARLLREESPVTRMLTDSSDTIAIENGADALATLLTEFSPYPPTAAAIPVMTYSASSPPTPISNSTTSSSPPSSSPSPATKPPQTSSAPQ